MLEFETKHSGQVIILSAPSGGGKSTILRALLDSDPSFSYSISATTRTPRRDEINGKNYYFMSRDEFIQIRQDGGFYESFEVHGNLYGTLRTEVDNKLEEGMDVLLDVDVQGSIRLKQVIEDCTSIFILPPSMATLEKRLRARGTDEETEIRRRMTNAREEVKLAPTYDYNLVNDDLDKTIENVKTIIHAQKFRSNRVRIHNALGELVTPGG